MDKYIEITLGKEIGRYKIENSSVDDFIDTFNYAGVLNKIKDITYLEYEKHKKNSINFKVEGNPEFTVEYYPFKHSNKRNELEWINMIKKYNNIPQGN